MMNKFIFALCIMSLFTNCATKLTEDKRLALKSELKEMVKIDQIAASRWEEEWAKYKDSVYTSNKIKAEKMFYDYGFLGFDKVGKDGSSDFWLIVQHCDKFPEFQKQVLKEMDRQVKRKNANAGNYAYLFDRVQVNAGLKQKFGTQVDYHVGTTGKAFPKNGLMDSINVDKVRKEYDLDSLKVYLNSMTDMHYEMNKEYYQKKGITKPDLY